MKVIAIAKGYYNELIEPGQTFDVPDGWKGTWFEPVKAEAKPAPKGKGKPVEDDEPEI